MSPDQIEIHQVMAPRCIVTFDIPLNKDYQKQCIDEAYKIGDHMKHETNVKASMSTWRVYEQTSVYNQILTDITGSLGHAPWVNLMAFVYTLHSAWVSIYREGDLTVPHTHDPSAVSFCYYLKADKSSSPLVFDEANFSIQPRSGLCVLFTGDLCHSVPKQEGGEDRLILAGNFEHARK